MRRSRFLHKRPPGFEFLTRNRIAEWRYEKSAGVFPRGLGSARDGQTNVIVHERPESEFTSRKY